MQTGMNNNNLTSTNNYYKIGTLWECSHEDNPKHHACWTICYRFCPECDLPLRCRDVSQPLSDDHTFFLLRGVPALFEHSEPKNTENKINYLLHEQHINKYYRYELQNQRVSTRHQLSFYSI